MKYYLSFVLVLCTVFLTVSNPTFATGPTPLPGANEQEFTGAGIYQFYASRNDPPYAPWVKGGEYMNWWCSVESTVGNYNWSAIDAQINDAINRGIKAGLKIEPFSYTEPDCPAGTICYSGTLCNSTSRKDGNLLPSDTLDAEDLNTYYVICPMDNTTYGYHRVPKYWSPEFKTVYKNMITALANHLKANPNLKNAVSQIDIAMGNYGEMDPSRNTDEQCLLSKGLSEDIWNSYVREIIDHFTTQFTGTGIVPVLQGSNFYTDVDSRYVSNMYAVTRGAGVYHTRPHADQNSVYSTYKQGQWDFTQDANNSVAYGQEFPEFNMGYGGDLNEPENDYWTLAFVLQDKSDYLRARTFPRGDLKRLTYDNPYVLQMINEYNTLAGKTTASAPYAKTWMRESKMPYYPACGNFDYYLYASSAPPPATTPDGQTMRCQPQTLSTIDGNAVALWNLDSTHQNLCTSGSAVYDLDCDPRFKYARKTASGNPYIYLDVDSRYANGVTSGIIRTVYLDDGTDQLGLEYKNSAGVVQNVALTKTNTESWKEWVITVPSINLNDSFTSGPTNWDFRLDDKGDGFDTIHSISFEDTSDGTANTPTPTQVITSITPSATPTSSHANCSAQKLLGDYNCDTVVNDADYTLWSEDVRQGLTTLSFFEYWRRATYH